MINFVSIRVLVSLMDGKLHTAKELAENNEVSKKTIQRAIATLLCAGVAVETKTGSKGGYYLHKNFIPQLLSTDKQTLSEFFSLASQMNEILPNQSSSLEECIIQSTPTNNIKEIIAGSNKIILDCLPWGVSSIDNTKFDILYSACMDSKIVEYDYINYKNQVSHRQLEPYCMTMKSGSWYVYGVDSGYFKLFKLTRMSNVTKTNIVFSPQEIDIKSKPWNNSARGTTHEVKLKIKSHRLDITREWLDFKSNVTNNNEVVATAIVSDNDNFYNKLILESENIELLSPKWMVEKLISKCNNIRQIYISN